MRKQLTLLVIILTTTACNFNSTFHRSVQVPVDMEEMTFYHHGGDTTFFKIDTKTQLVSLAKSNGEIINESHSIENTYFQSKSGNRLNAWILKPKNVPPVATLLYFHGSAQNILFHYECIRPLADRGFQIVMPDYSGYGFSQGKSTRDNALKDAYSALSFVKDTEQFKDQPLVLYGQSYGGYLASIVGANRQQEIDGIVIEGAFSSHRKEASHKLPILGNLVKQGMTASEEIRKNYKPVLVIHSKDDTMVPFRFGEKIYASANSPKAFYPIDGTHIEGVKDYPEEISAKIKSFILAR